MSARVFVLMKIQAGLFCGCLVSFLLSWPWQWVFFCVSVSPVVSCLRLARISEPPQAPQPIHFYHFKLRPSLSSCAGMHYLPACMPPPYACILVIPWQCMGTWLNTGTGYADGCVLSVCSDNLCDLLFWDFFQDDLDNRVTTLCNTPNLYLKKPL